MPWYSLNVSRHIVAVVFSVHCGGSCIWLPMNSWFILFLCPIIFLIICYFSLTLMLSSAGPDSNLVTLSCIFFNLFLISAATLSNNRITWKREAGISGLHICYINTITPTHASVSTATPLFEERSWPLVFATVQYVVNRFEKWVFQFLKTKHLLVFFPVGEPIIIRIIARQLFFAWQLLLSAGDTNGFINVLEPMFQESPFRSRVELRPHPKAASKLYSRDSSI